ncbi:MAG: lamin tail domain-containing protein [Myxococcales bacterium]
MTNRSLRLLAALAFASALSACPPPSSNTACTGLVAGDLVITEYMNNPDGTDSGKEWFEIYNATSKEVDLRGVTIGFAKVDGSSSKTHSVTAGKVAAGGYFVFGDAETASKPAWEDYSYGEKLGASGMSNSSGQIFIKCGAAKVDEVTWDAASPSGKARELDGKIVPDSSTNDKAENWCDATTTLEGNDLGTPGEANDACASSANCIGEGGASRTVVSPKEGELVITEFMARPATAISTTGEWVEVYATVDVDLNGLTLSSGTKKTLIAANECLAVAAGTYFVLAKTDDPTQNGGLPTPAALFNFDLTNDPTAATDISLKKGETLIDQVWYEASTEGIASQLDTCKLDPYVSACTDPCKNDGSCASAASANDNQLAFCNGEVAWGTGTEKGSPGEANAVCANAPDIKKCAENGADRDVVRPTIGDIAITEIMTKPAGAADFQAWFEVYVNKEIDLNGLELSNGKSKQVLAPRDCLKVAAGSYVVFARSLAATENGGLPQGAVVGTFGFDLPSTGGTLTLTLDDGLIVLDTVNYLPATSGQSTALDACKADPYSVPACTDACKADQSCPAAATSNDDPVTFCLGTKEYGNANNKGTPGEANPICPPVVDPTKCMDNGTQRASVPPTVGSLVVTEIMASPTGTDDLLEWFEVYVKADADLNGLVLANGSTPSSGKTTLSSENCIKVTRGQYLVFGRVTNPVSNGGIEQMAGVFGFGLSSQGSVVLKHGVDVIDFALYTAAKEGEALQLGTTGSEPDASTNDATTAFCSATEGYGTTDNLGTPGLANGICEPPIDPDTCTDSGQTNPRAVVKPAVGDLVISEVMASPTGTQSNKEWVEVYFKKDVDLNGVEFAIGTTSFQILSKTCIRPGAGGYAILARSADPLVNGGLTNVAATFDGDLSGTGATLWLTRDDNVIDKVTYSAATSGTSLQLASTKLDATENDSATSWCPADATATYGTTTTDHGTPGTANGACLCAGSTCGAETPCNPTNGACECTANSCVLPKSCDMATKQCVTVDPNQCTDSGTGTSRPMVVPAAGDLVISEYMANPNVVADSSGEWIEIYVKTDVDLNGVQLTINTSKYALAAGATCVRPGAGKYVLAARSDVAATNGGLPAVQAVFSTDLTNSGNPQTLTLSRDTVTIDTVTTIQPATAGASKQLANTMLDATSNDTAANWCNTATGVTYASDGNRGTPGLANGTCP